MNSLELVRKLYEDGVDPAKLEQELDEASRDELRQLVEAKDALSSLPRAKPSPGVLDAVVAEAVRGRKPKTGLTLVASGRMLQRLAAAAVVVVAVGVGYLALRTGSTLPVSPDEIEALAREEPARQALSPVDELEEAEGQIAAKPSPDTEAPASSFADADNNDVGRFRSNAPSQPAPVGKERGAGLAMRTERSVADGREDKAVEVERDFTDDLDAELHFPAAEMAAEPEVRSENAELLAWDREEEALRTLFWQVQALGGRSPEEDWEEAVPLEGSFEQLEKQQSGDGWLQTRSKK